MNIRFEDFQHNLENLRARVTEFCRVCGRDAAEVKVLPVTKTRPPEAAVFAARCGLPAVGENRVQEAAGKKPLVHTSLRWELIGHLQTNKAKTAAALFDRIQSVDRSKTARALGRHCAELGKVMPVLMQVNAGDDPAKFGVSIEEAPALAEILMETENLRLEGLMTIAPLDPDPAAACFNRLRELRDSLADRLGVPLPELSMGMTDDLEEAVKTGSTMVRVGSALYGARARG